MRKKCDEGGCVQWDGSKWVDVPLTNKQKMQKMLKEVQDNSPQAKMKKILKEVQDNSPEARRKNSPTAKAKEHEDLIKKVLGS